eukprot:8846789-Pyramimonas_sp.AAC.1
MGQRSGGGAGRPASSLAAREQKVSPAWTRPVEAWVPSSTLRAAGQVAPGPLSLLRTEGKRCQSLWLAETEL